MIAEPSRRCGSAARMIDRCVDVRPERPVDLLGRDGGEVLRRRLGAGVVDDDVQAAELAYGALHGLGAVFLVGQVAGDEQAVTPGVPYELRSVPGVVVFAEVRDRDVRALLRECRADRAPDPGVPAGDQGPFSVQQPAPAVAAHLIARMRIHRRRPPRRRLFLPRRSTRVIAHTRLLTTPEAINHAERTTTRCARRQDHPRSRLVPRPSTASRRVQKGLNGGAASSCPSLRSSRSPAPTASGGSSASPSDST